MMMVISLVKVDKKIIAVATVHLESLVRMLAIISVTSIIPLKQHRQLISRTGPLTNKIRSPTFYQKDQNMTLGFGKVTIVSL